MVKEADLYKTEFLSCPFTHLILITIELVWMYVWRDIYMYMEFEVILTVHRRYYVEIK